MSGCDTGCTSCGPACSTPPPPIDEPDPDERYLDEHQLVVGTLDTEDAFELLAVMGDATLLPPAPWVLCGGCFTPIRLWPTVGGWVHELGLAARCGCTDARPMVTVGL